jgi:hypothetical protein
MTFVAVLVAVVLTVTSTLLAVTPIVDAHRRAALRRIVTDVCRTFAEHEIDYWCDFGTLLGFYREGDIINGDKDADLSIIESERPKVIALAGVLRDRGYDLTDRGGRARKLIRIYESKTRYYLDVYPYAPDGAMLRSILASPEEDIPARLVARRVSAPFLGASVRVPEDVPAVLQYRYGSEFRTPRRGDKGSTRRFSHVRRILEDVQDNFLGILAWLR